MIPWWLFLVFAAGLGLMLILPGEE